MKYHSIYMGFSIALACATTAANAESPFQHDFQSMVEQLPIADQKVSMTPRPIVFRGKETPGQHDCLWMGPVYAGAFNIAYPDGGAVYWATAFSMPENTPGAYLEIAGSFPQARYMSLHSYTEGGAPYDHIMDVDIQPDAGSENPYLSGSYDGAMRYTLRVMQGATPDVRAPNTVYFGPADKMDRSPLMIRHYIPETGDDLTGGAGLPSVTLVMPDGTRLSGQAACDALGSPGPDDPKRVLFSPALAQADFDQMLEKPEVSKNYLHTKKEDWDVFWDPRINLMAFMSPKLQEVMKTAARVGFLPKTSGFYANLDNQYVSITLNEDFGKVVVIEAQLPRIPDRGADMAQPENYDLRYWSLCSNESLVTTRFSDCLYDSDIALTDDRRYKIVVSKAANRPINARKECGVSWLDWGDAGDGAGHPQITALLLRNMAPNPNFGAAVQDIAGPGLEAATMGPYLPKPIYTTKAAFEGRGC